MKNVYFRSLVLVALTLATACKKSSTSPEAAAALQLTKITSWNSSTGGETVMAEYNYTAEGLLKTVLSARVTLDVAYVNGKVAVAKGINSSGGEVSYTMTYNSAGQVTKVVYIFMNPTDYGWTKNYEYNTAGKISKMTTTYVNGGGAVTSSVTEYFWNGDNIEGSKATSVASSIQTSYKYDNQLNPYSLGDGLAAILAGSPQSKNNATEITTISAAGTSVQKRSYEYHATGYASSMKLMDGSNEGNKFYYNK